MHNTVPSTDLWNHRVIIRREGVGIAYAKKYEKEIDAVDYSTWHVQQASICQTHYVQGRICQSGQTIDHARQHLLAAGSS